MGDRYEELTAKRRESGLTVEEANELGKLMAEKEGRKEDYANATNPPEEVEVERAGTVETEEELQEVKEEEQAKEEERPEEEAGGGMAKDVDDTPLDTQRLRAAQKDAPPPA
jgi:hypothetical protein